MATNKSVTYLYNYGSSVAVRCDAPERYQGINKGSICGIRKIDSNKSAIEIGEPVGTLLYLVEDKNGQSLEIPERHLKMLNDE